MFIQLISYVLTAILNPGLPKREMFKKLNNNNEIAIIDVGRVRWCDRCDVLMNLEINTKHCYDCEICIEGNNNMY